MGRGQGGRTAYEMSCLARRWGMLCLDDNAAAPPRGAPLAYALLCATT